MQMRPSEKIWLPGQGVVDMAPMKVHRAVSQYDERLMFGRHDNGDWCIFVKMPHGKDPLPVLGFGTELPTPEEAVRRADAANTRRHGQKVLDQIMADDRRRRAKIEKESEELAEVYAEIMMDAQGVKNPSIYVPRGI